MGQRANYVLVDERGRWSLYYSHVAANTVDADLFWGPDNAIAFIRAQEQTTHWLNDVWCEGGALVDLQRRTLLFFGGEDIRWEVLRHRLAIALMQRVWHGWTVRWAFEGLGDVVDHIGVSRSVVRSDQPYEEYEPDEHLFGHRLVSSIISMQGADGCLSLATFVRNASDLAIYSPAVVKLLADSRDAITLPLHGKGRPTSGAHLDVAARRIHLWQASFCQDLREQLARRWSGWELVHYGAEFESQLALTDGALTLTLPRQEEVASEIVRYLLGSFKYNPRELPEDERTRVLAQALAGLPRQPGFAPSPAP